VIDLESKIDSVQVGDVFTYSWGYDQTNIDFYAVVGVSASGKTLKVQKCEGFVLSDNGFNKIVSPDPSRPWTREFRDEDGEKVIEVAPVLTKRLQRFKETDKSLKDNAYIRMSCGYARWSTAPRRESGDLAQR